MDFLKKVNALVLGLAVLLAVGCGGDEPEPDPQNNPGNEKEVLTQIIKQQAGQNTKQTFEYNSEYKIAKVVNEFQDATGTFSSYSLIDYNSAGKIKKVTTYDTNNQAYAYKTYDYNNAGQVNSIENYFKDFTSGAIALQQKVTYEYDSIDHLKTQRFFNNQNTLTQYYTFSNLISGSTYKDEYVMVNGNAELRRTLEYTFDNNMGINQLLGVLYDEDLISSHNINTMRIIPHPSNPVKYYYYSYTYNATGYPTEQIIKNYPNQDMKTTFVYELR
jgi:hypothetical protein